jgi:uncharacterized protein (TIGR02001 family)
MSLIRAARFGFSALFLLAVVLTATPALAQDPAPPVVVTGGIDFTNQYDFRGIRQNSEGVSIWPYVDFAFTPFRGDGTLKSVGVNIGTWNAINSQLSDNKLYETDFYATLALGFNRAALGFTYTSYTSPADLFAHVKELALKLSVDDSAALGRGALKPYFLVAFELTDDGQADAGASKGTYIELGVAPGVSFPKASLAIPVKVGLSASDYYEFGTGADSKFGYFSVAGIVTVPMGAHLNVHGGVEVQAFGDTVKAYNGQDAAALASIGLGFAF